MEGGGGGGAGAGGGARERRIEEHERRPHYRLLPEVGRQGGEHEEVKVGEEVDGARTESSG